MMSVIKNIKVGINYYLLEIDAPEIAMSGKPGQFVHIKIKKDDITLDPLLRRPFSIHDCDHSKGTIKLVYRVVGRGTKLMTAFNKNDKIDLIGPLGQGFKIDFISSDILIIGGGMGIVPLYYLSKKIKSTNNVMVLLGGNNKQELKYFINSFSRLNIEMKVATMDGSTDHRGTVIDLWQEKYHDYKPDFIYSCGPEVMLKKVQNIALENNLKGQVSLEERMGCGIGVCLSCVCETQHGNQRLCKEGPVLSLNEVIFNEKT